MTGKAVIVAKDQTNRTTNILKAKNIVTGKITLADLTEPYFFLYDDDISVNNAEEEQDHLAKALSKILAKHLGYKIVTPCYMGMISDRVVCMVK